MMMEGKLDSLPDTDSREVMEMAVAALLVDRIWEQVARAIHSDDAEEMILGIYSRVYNSVSQTHKVD